MLPMLRIHHGVLVLVGDNDTMTLFDVFCHVATVSRIIMVAICAMLVNRPPRHHDEDGRHRRHNNWNVALGTVTMVT